jgi:hypothetical protein
MKPFWLFAGDYYYPSGGMDDFKDSFDTLEAAKAAAPCGVLTWAHVWHDGAIVATCDEGEWE